MFSDFLRIFIVRFDLIFQADQIIINDTEQKVWSIEDDGQSSDQEREILVLKKENKTWLNHRTHCTLTKSKTFQEN